MPGVVRTDKGFNGGLISQYTSLSQMTDDPGDQDNKRFDSASSEEWVDKIAESEGLSREDVLERLISSYWTLKEMFRLMEQTEEGLEGRAGPDDVDMSAAGRPSSPDFESFKEEVTDQLDSLRGDLEALEAEVQAPDKETERLSAELKGVDDRVSDIHAGLSERQNTLESRIDDEFENLEVILDYLIETTDDIDTRTAELSEAQRGLNRRLDERDRLAEFKQRANRKGVRKANCGYCEASVDIAMLERPVCPQCDRFIVDVEPTRGWFGLGSNRLEVSDDPPETDEADLDSEAEGKVFDPEDFESRD